MNLILCGYKSCGKTTVGKAYSAAYGYAFLDTDALLTQIYQVKMAEVGSLYRSLGAAEFRKKEALMVQSIQPELKTIIATGGGVVLNKESVEHLRSLGKILYLSVAPQELFKRIMTSSTLPEFIAEAADPALALRDYLRSRDAVYSTVSDHTIDANNMSVEEIIERIHQYRCHYGQ